jgi:hypothetical protein
MYGKKSYTKKKTRFRTKKPIRSFRDLEVYQRTQEIATQIMKTIAPVLSGKNYHSESAFIETALSIPEKMAEAHSRRFDDEQLALQLLNDTKIKCNKMIVYLEQIKNIYGEDKEGIDKVVCEDIIKKYNVVRIKIRNLYKAWYKFMVEDESKER